MGRYTVIRVHLKSKPNQEAIRSLSGLFSEISATIETYGGLAYRPLPWLILLLSNGVSEAKHKEIFQRIRSDDNLEAKMASITSVNPVHAVLVAMRMLRSYEYYFQSGEETPYSIGVFTVKRTGDQGDVLSEIATRLRLHFDISRTLLTTGGLPLSVSLERVVGVLRDNSIEYIQSLLRHVSIGVGVDYRALDALRKAEENTLISD